VKLRHIILLGILGPDDDRPGCGKREPVLARMRTGKDYHGRFQNDFLRRFRTEETRSDSRTKSAKTPSVKWLPILALYQEALTRGYDKRPQVKDQVLTK